MLSTMATEVTKRCTCGQTENNSCFYRLVICGCCMFRCLFQESVRSRFVDNYAMSRCRRKRRSEGTWRGTTTYNWWCGTPTARESSGSQTFRPMGLRKE